ncbi:MAG: amidohydrolase [Candidatus Hydrogenedentes bacterium]|nr:amidohydrolase [Candidatus Hydrogenedentota bacterium]
MIIDCHAHIITSEDAELKQILEAADQAGIAKIAISSLGRPPRGWEHSPSPEHQDEANEDVVRACAKHPDRFIGQVYLSADHVDRSLEALERDVVNGPCKAIKLWMSQLADDARLDPIYERAIELDIPILQHTWFKAVGHAPRESTCHHVVNAVKRHPNLKVWMAHAGGRWEEAGRIVKDYPNVCMDISGGEPEDGIVECLLKHVGPERIFFGADIPGRSFVVQMTKVLAADIPERHKQMILGENAAKWLCD